MRQLPLPAVDDVTILKTIASRRPLNRCPHGARNLSKIEARYESYLLARGNAASYLAPKPITMQGELPEALLLRYKSKTQTLTHIKQTRFGSPNICPMCGSPLCLSVDHVFPQSDFPELAIYSKNLVPACTGCNSARRNNYRGAGIGERVLHPYFDSELTQRLAYAKILPQDAQFKLVNFELKAVIRRNHALYPALSYHLEHVIENSGALAWFKSAWPDFVRKSRGNFHKLPKGRFSDNQFRGAVEFALKLADEEFSTPNNWKSMLLSGLLRNPIACKAVAQKIRDLRAGRLRIEDI